MRVCAYVNLVALLPVLAFSQSTETPAKFDVADVHTSARAMPPVVRGPFYSSGRYELRFATMLDLIRIAYNVDPEKVSGGPSWLEMDRFDVFAKLPAGSTAESRRLMLQALLADRFKLQIHNDNKPMAAYALTAGKQPKLKEAEGANETGCEFTLQNAPTAPPLAAVRSQCLPSHTPVGTRAWKLLREDCLQWQERPRISITSW